MGKHEPKDYLFRRAQRIQRLKLRRAKIFYRAGKRQAVPQVTRNPTVAITDTHKAPAILSLLNNSDEVLTFFNKLKGSYEKGRKIVLDLSDVNTLTPDAIIYMLSQMHYLERKYGRISISGNVPTDKNCESLFINSGFMKYVHFQGNLPPKDPDILTIRSGVQVVGEVATDVVTFARERLGTTRNVRSRKVYRIILEAMGNTFEHAYDDSSVSPNWYLIALNHPDTSRVTFAFLDGGAGIPNTVQKRISERTLRKISKISDRMVPSNDAKIIDSAFMGKIPRTRTGKSNRGLGLPGIYNIFESGLIDDLIVISGFGYIDYRKSLRSELNLPFEGTLIVWDFLP